MGELTGRVALVTGASRGIGAAAARALAAAGALVAVTDLHSPDAIAAEIGGLSRAQDVTSEDDWSAVMDWLANDAGGLDILVNNAGIFLMKALVDTSLEEWRRLHAVNVEGVFLGTRAAIPLLAARASKWAGGTAIVNLSSMAGLVGSPRIAAYNASKGAVRLFTKGAAMELAPSGIRVNSVHPGVIETAMGQEVIDGFSALAGLGANEGRAMVDQSTPLGRMGQPGNVADAIVFLASDRAAYMTGAEIVIDGGATASS
jgi:NAD(P)-dependent dehydrogenase (short-subunit alcohol dehydrogenase family)